MDYSNYPLGAGIMFVGVCLAIWCAARAQGQLDKANEQDDQKELISARNAYIVTAIILIAVFTYFSALVDNLTSLYESAGWYYPH
jgi:cytosine/uracil/thiamine/allantoin permease